ncbi:MAG: proliferating cell nuclear antigen (pcna) [Candidatus Anstonellales archaeon]
MFRIVVSDARSFKGAIDSIVNLIDEGQLEFTTEGIRLKAMDTSQIAMVCFFMPKDVFLEYDVQSTSRVGINFDSLSKVLGRARAGEQLEVLEDENKLVLRFVAEKKKRSFKLPIIEMPSGIQKEPLIEHDAFVKITAAALKELLKDAALISSHITFEANDSGFFADVKGDGANLHSEYEKDSSEISEIIAKASSRATFPLQYLDDVTKAAPDTEEIEIKLKTNAPIKITYEVEGANVSYYLAPRLDSD